MSNELLEMTTEIRDRLIRMETKMEDLPQIRASIQRHEVEIAKAKASVKSIKWFAGIIFITIPAGIAAVVKVFKGG